MTDVSLRFECYGDNEDDEVLHRMNEKAEEYRIKKVEEKKYRTTQEKRMSPTK